MPDPNFMELGIHIMELNSISAAYFINTSYQTVSVYVAPVIARQRLDKNVTAAINTQATLEELLNAFFCAVRVVSSKVGDMFFLKLIVF
jgi:hypothetical protein